MRRTIAVCEFMSSASSSSLPFDKSTNQIDRREKNSVDTLDERNTNTTGIRSRFMRIGVNERSNDCESSRRNHDFQSSYFVSFPATIQRTNRSPFFPPPPIFLSPLSLSFSPLSDVYFSPR